MLSFRSKTFSQLFIVEQAADGAGLGQVGGLIGTEALVGLAYAVAGFGLFSFFERSARANATLDVR